MQTQTITTSTSHHGARPVRRQVKTPVARPTAASFFASVPNKTMRALLACFWQQTSEPVTGKMEKQCNAALDEFMSALYRVTEQAELWQLVPLLSLAPMVFALDAQLEARQAGVSITQEEFFEVIRAAKQAAETPADWHW